MNEATQRPTPAAAPVSATVAEESFVKPHSSGRMNSSQLAWMLREKIVLDIMERMVSGGPELEAYNMRVREYNALAAAIEYKESEMASAFRLVEEMKGDITRDAVMETITLAMPIKAMADSKVGTIWRAQKFLSLFGYYPVVIDGEENDGTLSAVKMYELKSDKPITGRIDESLAEDLAESWITRNTPRDVSLGR